MIKLSLWRLVPILLLLGCSQRYNTTALHYNYYRTADSLPADAGMQALLKPYADSVKRSMDQVIAQVGTQLEKQQPEGTLGNVMTDALLVMAREKFNVNVDAAILNFGGIRTTTVMPGPLTRGKVFQMMPFNNLMLLQTMPGDTLKAYLDVMAGYGGWPVSGISYVIRDRKATDIKVNGVPLRGDQLYTIANSDYVAGGGDRMPVLDVPVKNIGLMMRDALMEYFERYGRENKPITATLQNRVTHAN
ncbi:5'-nucleotidase C-terminal domain-containing protein [Parasegetibacter sp. NRK P23]|uniref:5'-nucleotidase C-terminal domain-containing protein n=1 Tax=Parasegetibacter sp. NRK P23 TaxID=2942999 RepID=UPI00204443D2|nr:5'-nucleotidase C-terminal domain-containing protein [Parasegetibacter sp. NRK P23]MCM5530511.1 5'-nucleotidase C-terminal domain-containing protein [Parasegetibacter sp. NRK P23]